MSLEEILNRAISRPALRTPPAVGELRRVAITPEVRAVNEARREITFVASDETVDRYGDIIRAAFWETKTYLKNPVFLWAHQSTSPPIGKTVALSVESNALIQTVEFASKETYEFADTVYNLYKNGFLNAVSVGFRPTEKPKPIRDPSTDQITGFEFVGQELLELSAVPIPANPNACMRAISEGIITRADAGKFFREKIDNPELALEFDLAQISLERVRLTLLELQVKNLLSELRGSAVPPPAREQIKNLGQLETALRGKAN